MDQLLLLRPHRRTGDRHRNGNGQYCRLFPVTGFQHEQHLYLSERRDLDLYLLKRLADGNRAAENAAALRLCTDGRRRSGPDDQPQHRAVLGVDVRTRPGQRDHHVHRDLPDYPYV
ncbi:hypothetical protein D3C76_1080400 [compost metagenome]